MNDKPKLRDAFFAKPRNPNAGTAAQKGADDAAPKESLETILQDEFKADVRRLKMGCLLVWHIGGILLLLLILVASLMALYDAIHKAIFG